MPAIASPRTEAAQLAAEDHCAPPPRGWRQCCLLLRRPRVVQKARRLALMPWPPLVLTLNSVKTAAAAAGVADVGVVAAAVVHAQTGTAAEELPASHRQRAAERLEP